MPGDIIIISDDTDDDGNNNNQRWLNLRSHRLTPRRHLEDDDDRPIIPSYFFSETETHDSGRYKTHDDVVIVAHTGEIASIDFPHSRHLCGKYPFNEISHKRYCKMCYCYVCDEAAPCKYWKSHCHACEEISFWRDLRENYKGIFAKKVVVNTKAIERKETKVGIKKSVEVIVIESSDDDDSSSDYGDDDDCVEIDPLEFTCKLHLDDLDPAADVVAVACKGPVALRDFPHPRHLCGNFPFRSTAHESYCSKCFCYVCEITAPCSNWKGIKGHCNISTEEEKLAAKSSRL